MLSRKTIFLHLYATKLQYLREMLLGVSFIGHWGQSARFRLQRFVGNVVYRTSYLLRLLGTIPSKLVECCLGRSSAASAGWL
jgi:hypothetical protein